MVRKGIVGARAKRGIIPSKDPFKDRARTVYYIIRKFEIYFTKSQRDSMAKLATKIIKIGDKESLFSGRDPYISGVAIFFYVCRRFSYDSKCIVTYDDVRTNCAHFSSGSSFVGMLNMLSKRFGNPVRYY